MFVFYSNLTKNLHGLINRYSVRFHDNSEGGNFVGHPLGYLVGLQVSLASLYKCT